MDVGKEGDGPYVTGSGQANAGLDEEEEEVSIHAELHGTNQLAAKPRGTT